MEKLRANGRRLLGRRVQTFLVPAPRGRKPERREPYAKRLGDETVEALLPSQHRSPAVAYPINGVLHSIVIVVPTVPITNASGNRAAICWQAFQPVQCAGTSSDGESSASASTVGPMIGSNIGPLR